MYFSTTLILLLTVLDILVYYLQKLQEEDNGKHTNSSSIDERSMDEADRGERKDSPYKQCTIFSLAEIKLATNDFDDAFVIGNGGFGKVYKGKVDLGGELDVAIKRPDLDSNQGATEFWVEIEMLSKFRHSHIVSLLGYCEIEMILVYEYMPNGSLADHLHKQISNSSPLTWIQRLNICIGVSRGLDYLHTGTGVEDRVIHRDVKSSNILLDENLAGKIADFGLSRTTPASHSGSTTNVYTDRIISTFGYMDAEYFSTHRITRKSDVYAFGVVLLEVLCGRPALDFTLDEQQHSLAGWAKHCIKRGNIRRILDPCLTGQVPTKCLKEFGQIAYKCISTCSKDRPTMTMVLARLERVLTWTMQSVQRASNGKHTALSLFYTKTFLMKTPRRVISDRKKDGCDSGGGAAASQQVVPPSGDTTTLNLKEFTYSELLTATHNGDHLGEGDFGRVVKWWLDRVTYTPQKAGNGLPVAIKISNYMSIRKLKQWQAEVYILGKFRHPNLVKLLGYCQENRELLLVYEYMQKASLRKHLSGDFGEALPWYTRIKIAIGAAQALAFLHSTENNVIHGDVHTCNILLDEEFNAKLSDFGSARLGPANGETTRVTRTYGMAPEYVATGQLYAKSDVYGFGVVMLEIITGLRVYDTSRHAIEHYLVEWSRPFLSDKNKIQRVMDPRLENYPSRAAYKIAELILTCLEPEPYNRPCMEDIVSCLQGINAIEMDPSK